MHRRFVALLALAGLACSNGDASPTPAADAVPAPGPDAPALVADTTPSPAGQLRDSTTRPPNELGKIPILEYHLIGDSEGRWQRERSRFRQDLELLYERGYRPVSVAELVDGRIDLPAGLSPVVFTFDDASPSQFRYVELADGTLAIDSTSAIGIWLDFARTRPDWAPRATFCLLSGAEAGRSFFGNKGIEGQRTEWRFAKVRFLAEQGFELCNHTLWHANLGKYDDAFVQEQIARGVMAIDSAVPGYRVRTLALPLGVWPKNRELAVRGSWRDPKSGRVVEYHFDAVLEVAGYPVPGPAAPGFTPLSLDRVQVYGDRLEQTLDQLERSGQRWVSGGRK
ncbi:MAG TPA: polysaccharide deacetylase family protein [Gemmatimonadaceae bacterium]|nr:polysaccharide deacetylase family protein [Gemmatimonadaceae bacterium]